MTASTRDRIISLLGQNISQQVVAEAVGVTPAYVSQLLLVPEVVSEIALLRSKKLEAAIETDDMIESVELMALKKTKDLMPFVKSASEASKIFVNLNAARKKAIADAGTQNAGGGMQVTLVLPKAAKVIVTVNSDNQVIDVDGKTTAPLPSKALPLLARERAPSTMMVHQITDVPVRQVVEIPPHAHELQQRHAERDAKRAVSILNDMTTMLNGVEIVI